MEAIPKFEEFSEKHIIHRFDYKPSFRVPIVQLENQTRVIYLLSWGFVPSWAKGKQTTKPINARSETVASSGMYRAAFKSNRCLIPADGFYEPKGPKAGKRREQFYFHRPDDEIFAMAGVFSGVTFALLTTTPNAVVGPIHERMPVILNRADYRKWLDPQTEPDELQALLKPADVELVVVAETPPPEVREPGLFG